MATLPSKRSPNSPPEGSASSKKSKAELKRQSLSKAQQWAAERKRKKEGGGDDDAKKLKHEDEIAEGEERDVLENLPSPAKSNRSRRSNRGADDASHASEITESSIGSRRSSRRRTMSAKTASATSSTTARSTRRGRKSEAPVADEPVEVVAPEEKIAEKKDPAEVVETKAPTPTKATPKKKEPTPKKVDGAAAIEEETQKGGSGLKIRSFIPQFSVFFYTIFLQWSIVSAVVMIFFLDWFAYEFHPQGADADYSNQRTFCAILGFWLVTLAGYSIVLGPHSMVGWIIATSSLAMAKGAMKMDWGENYDTILPSLPLYSIASLDITVLDALIFIGFAGWFVLYFKEPEHIEQGTSGDVAEEIEAKSDVQVAVGTDVEKSGPYSFIGDRAAVDKSGVTYIGTVTAYNSDSRAWTVKYGAGEGLEDDELNRLEIASAFRLYSKELADRLKAMWRANEI